MEILFWVIFGWFFQAEKILVDRNRMVYQIVPVESESKISRYAEKPAAQVLLGFPTLQMFEQ
jgi:type II restriction/modification system DNA methylase subunit YeeA